MEAKYYECHVTVEPVFEDRLEQLNTIAKKHGFRVANLLMQRRAKETPLRSDKDSFCTGRDLSFTQLETNMNRFVNELVEARFQVWRQKIEAVLIDVRTKPGS